MRKKACELQYLETLAQRVTLSFSEQQDLADRQKGMQGELTIDTMTEKVTQGQYSMEDDINLDFNGRRVQIDKLLQIDKKLYLIDMKNYRGQYVCQKRTWYRNGKPLAHSIFGQIERAHDILARILAENNVQLEVVKVLIFTDPRVSLQIEDESASGIVIKTLWEYCDWIQRLCLVAPITQPLAWKEAIQKYSVGPYRMETDFSADQRDLRKGIYCPQCGNFRWKQEYYALQCRKCGYREAKEIAYVRTICDYGTLFFRRNLKVSELVEFLGEGYSYSYLRIIVAKHFEPLPYKSRQACYLNKGMTFDYWFSEKVDYFKKIQKRAYWEKRNVIAVSKNKYSQ